jgi:CHC2 zinc finger
MSARQQFDAQSIKTSVSLAEVIGEHVNLRKRGPQAYLGLCPFHAEKTPSFHVSEARGFFKCFGCGKSGDLFNFAQELYGMSFSSAVQYFGERFGVTPINAARPTWARLTSSQRTEIERFRIGFGWELERYLDALKELALLEEPSPEDKRIHDVSRLLRRIQTWSTRTLLSFVVHYKEANPRYTARCIAEAAQFEQELACAIAGLRREAA